MAQKTCHKPDEFLIKRAAGIIRRGGVVVFPTTCLYGLGADAFNPLAVKRVFAIKKRLPDKPLLILIDLERDLEKVAKKLSHEIISTMTLFWPGKITFVIDAADTFSEEITAGTGKIGIRVPACTRAKRLVEFAGGPITGTSANISGMPAPSAPDDIDPVLSDAVDLVVSSGTLSGGVGSTIVDLTLDVPVILREGAVGKSEFYRILKNG